MVTDGRKVQIKTTIEIVEILKTRMEEEDLVLDLRMKLNEEVLEIEMVKNIMNKEALEVEMEKGIMNKVDMRNMTKEIIPTMEEMINEVKKVVKGGEMTQKTMIEQIDYLAEVMIDIMKELNMIDMKWLKEEKDTVEI